MNKKFLSAIMCGAMLTASTSVFVSCEDYGDDIAHLQEQIDQNATTAASELAAKVAALESQLSTLKAAQDNMKEQLASAKAEAAAAANNALSAAQAAQAAADKAQSGAADAKAAADKAQATADAASKALSDAVTKVAVLEAKIASLETAIAELSASNKELNTKLNDLQNAYNLLNVNVNANAEEIKAIKADLAAKTADLATQIATVSTTIGAQIDVINAELNTIKSTYATKGELNKTAEDLAALDAKLAEQIAANEAYVATMEATIAELEAADAEAAALIAANHEEALAKIADINAELAAQKAAVEKELETVKAQIADIEATVATLSQLATANYNDIATLRQALDEKTTEILELISQLTVADRGLNAQITAALEAIFALDGKVDANAADVEELISQLAATDRGFQTEFETIWGILDELNTASKDAAQQIVELIGADKGFAAQIEALLVDYTDNKELVAQQIINLSKADKDLKDDIVALMGDVKDLYEKLTSAVADLQAVDAKLAEQIKTLFAQAEIFGKDIKSLQDEVLALQTKDAELAKAIEDLVIALGDAEDKAATDLASAVETLNKTIADNKELAEKAVADLNTALTNLNNDLTTKIDAKYGELLGKIGDAMTAIADVNTALDTKFTTEIANLQGQIDAIINGLHSVVFVPQHAGKNFDFSVYHINTYVWNETQKKYVDGADVYPVSTVKFRVEPAGYAEKLAAAWDGGNHDFLKLESTATPTISRSSALSLLNIVDVDFDGDFLNVAVTKANDAVEHDTKHPTALVVAGSDITMSRTSDYFLVKFATEADANVVNRLMETGEGKGDAYKSYTEINYNELSKTSYAEVKLLHNKFGAYNIKKALRTELFEAVKDSKQLPYDGKIASNLRIVSVEGEPLKNGQWSNDFFTVKENGEVSVNSDKDGNAVKNNTKQQITVRVADDTYQKQFDGTNYVDVDYDVTFVIVENLYENTLTFNYAMTWPATTAAAQEITLASIEADVDGLAEYKLAAADVFNSLFKQVGTTGVTYNEGAYSITMVAVPATQAKEAHIVVTPNVSLTQNYNLDVENWAAAEFKDGALCSMIYINVNFDFTVPGVTDFFNKVRMYWDENTLEVDYTLNEAEGNEKYVYKVDMKKVYLFNKEWNGLVNYSWAVDAPKTEGHTYSNISFNDNGVLNINGVVREKDKNGNIVKVINVEDLTFTATAKDNAGHVLQTQADQKFNITYPIDINNIQSPDNVTFSLKDLKEGKEFNVTSAVSLKDIDGYTWIYEGAIVDETKAAELGLTSVAKAWTIKKPTYKITEVISDKQDLTEMELFGLDPAGGQLKINKSANITKPAYIKIKMTFGYQFEENLETSYTVIVDPTL